MAVDEHRKRAAGEPAGTGAVLTVTETQTRRSDASGRKAYDLIRQFGNSVGEHTIVPNDRQRIAKAVEYALRSADFVVTIGGTGVGKKDVTVDAVRPFIDKELPGFGEMFRALSAKKIGTATILSRALLGVTRDGKVIVSLPGSEDAVALALEEILLPELPHLVSELRR